MERMGRMDCDGFACVGLLVMDRCSLCAGVEWESDMLAGRGWE